MALVVNKIIIRSMNFNEYYWHDATIKNIQIDRTNPGVKDIILLEIEWPENKEKSIFIFEDVYWASFNLNFGVVCDETILSAELINGEDEDLDNFNSKWKGAMSDVKLNAYKIELNSTGSKLKIIAKRYKEHKV